MGKEEVNGYLEKVRGVSKERVGEEIKEGRRVVGGMCVEEKE